MSGPVSTTQRRLLTLISPPVIGSILLTVMVVACFATLPWSVQQSDDNQLARVLQAPAWFQSPILGTDDLGRSTAWRCMLGGAVSLSVGLLAATLAMVIGTTWGLIAGYAGGSIDALMMRIVDVLYGLPYILLVMLLAVAIDGGVYRTESWVVTRFGPDAPPAVAISHYRWIVQLAGLFIAIGAVSWLTLARVIRGQVLTLKHQPFIESTRAMGLPTWRILFRHLLPNLVGPIIVYTTLAVPQAILQESFLSFLGIGVKPPLPSWGNLAAEGLNYLNPVRSYWWLLLWPCLALGITLLALNFVGDGLRDRLDPRTGNNQAGR